MSAQPSLLAMWQAKMKSCVRQYRSAKEALDQLEVTLSESGDEFSPEWEKAHDKERVLRGTVRGAAMMMLVLSRPSEAAYRGENYSHAVHDLEVDYGMPGKKFIRSVLYGNQSGGKYAEDNREERSRGRT